MITELEQNAHETYAMEHNTPKQAQAPASGLTPDFATDHTSNDTPDCTSANAEHSSEPYDKTEKIREIVESFMPFGLASFLYGIFFCFCLYRNVKGVTSPLLGIGTLAFYLYSFYRLGISCPLSKKLFYGISIFLLGLSNMLTDSGVLIFLNYTGMILLLFCFLLQHFYETGKWDFSKYLGSLLKTIFCSVGNIGYPFRSLGLYLKQRQTEKSRRLYSVFLGILIAIPLLAVVGSLLLSADAVFRHFTDRLFANLLENIKFGNLFLMAFLVLFGIMASYGILIELAGEGIDDKMKDHRTMEPIVAITFTLVLTVIYLAFSIIQIMYLFIGNMQLPDGYTYAAYAREGFFQLLFVCLINLCLVLFCMKHYQDNKILKGILTVICGCTYIMIASSTMRMILYIQTYNLTFLRLFVLTALFVLLLCLTGVVISIYKEAFPLFSFMMTVVTVTYIVFSLVRPDRVIASYNIANSTAQDSYLYQLSLDAAPLMEKAGYFDNVEVTQDSCKEMDYRPYYPDKKDYIRFIQAENERMTLRTFNLSVYRAGKATSAHVIP